MKRRTFPGSLGTVATSTRVPGLLRGDEPRPVNELKTLLRSGSPLGGFPKVTAPRLFAVGDGLPAVLLHSAMATVLQRRQRRPSLRLLARARFAADPDGTMQIAGFRDGALWRLRLPPSGQPVSRRLAIVPEPHAAAGLDLVWTPDGVRIVPLHAEIRDDPPLRIRLVNQDAPGGDFNPLALSDSQEHTPSPRTNSKRVPRSSCSHTILDRMGGSADAQSSK
jgi:hypothetical protein